MVAVPIDARPDPMSVALALRQEAGVQRMAEELSAVGIDLLVLKGPPVQRRLLGSPAAYPSADVDVLVRRASAAAARRALTAAGWEFISLNGRLWRLDGAAAYVRDGVQVDVHWRLHASLVAPGRLRSLAEAMWTGATRTDEGWWEPAIAPLTAYLALHTADRLAHEGKRRALEAAVRAAEGSWSEVAALAAACGMSPVLEAVEAALDAPSPADDPPLLDTLTLTYGPRRAAAMRLFRQRLPAAVNRIASRGRSSQPSPSADPLGANVEHL
jgi:hypothetical protein